jgi:hypothetical protein
VSDWSIRIATCAVLAVHGLGHGGALAALAWIAARPGTNTGAWTAARSWLAPGLSANGATAVASGFWILSMVGFVAAALLFWFGHGDAWRTIAMVSAVVSFVGLVLFFGTWPTLETVAAVAVNAAVLIGLGLMRWSPPA